MKITVKLSVEIDQCINSWNSYSRLNLRFLFLQINFRELVESTFCVGEAVVNFSTFLEKGRKQEIILV